MQVKVRRDSKAVGHSTFKFRTSAIFQSSLLALVSMGGSLVQAADKPNTSPELGYSFANMDKRVSPRKDFLQYAAGNWLKRTDIPASQTDASGFTQLANNLNDKLLKLIQDAATGSQRNDLRRQVGDYYVAAMDLPRLDALGLKPLEADLQRIGKLDNPGALAIFMSDLELRYGASPFLNGFTSPDMKDSSMTVMNLYPGMSGLNQDEYASPSGQHIRDLYLDYISKMFQSTGESEAEAKAHARAVLVIETELAAAQLTPLQRRDPAVTYNKLMLSEAQALIPALDLSAFFSGLGIAAPATMLVPDLKGMRAVQKVLTERMPADLHALMRWHVLSARASVLGQTWRNMEQEFSRQRTGQQSSEARERVVTKEISLLLFHPLSQLYVQAYFPDSTRSEITEMVGHVKAEFETRLRSNRWLDEPTRQAALEKLSKVDIAVGYPQQWIDFSSIVIKPDDYFGNVQRAQSFLLRRDLAMLGKPVVRERFVGPNITTPIAVNAAYNPQYNNIDITAAIVQPPFYKPGADAAVNYCTVGAVIGHELTHGFDSQGRQYGPAGNLRDWWTPQATADFKKRTDVLVEQYSQFMILPGLMHNGALTVTENTADLGGITLAHAALQRYMKTHPLPKKDGLSADQRCFVAWSQLWASKARPERLRYLVANDYHSVNAVRAVAPLQHLDAFYQVFDIRAGDPMWRAPAKRVQIW
jgi:putative endopeptidase